MILKQLDWDLYHAKKVVSIKSQLLSQLSLTHSSTLNGPITVWLTIPAHIMTLPSLSCHLLATGTSELDKIHPWVYSSSIALELSRKITPENSVFMHFLIQFWHFKIFCLVKEGCLGYFLQTPIHKIFNTFCPSWLPQFQPFQILMSACQKWLFCYNLLSFTFIQGKQLVIAFFFGSSSQLIYSTITFYHSMILAKLLWSPKWTFPHSVTYLYSVFQLLLQHFLNPCFSIFYGQKEKKNLYLIAMFLR